jgi:hypothetical protein
VVAVAGVIDIANRFGMQGLRDAAKFLAEYVSFFAPPHAYESQLAWSVSALFVPDPSVPDPIVDATRMRSLVQTTDLELSSDESIRLDLAIGVADYDGVHADRAIDDAVREASVALTALVGEADGSIIIMDRARRPHFVDEYPG